MDYDHSDKEMILAGRIEKEKALLLSQ